MGNNKNVLLARGGSSIYSYKNMTSDIDLCCIYEDEMPVNILSYANSISADLEVKKYVEIQHLVDRLLDQEVSISSLFPVVNFYDLRFLTRCIIGELLIDGDGIRSYISSVQRQLQQHLRSHFSYRFYSIYKDIYGMIQNQQFDNVLLLAGELVQLAIIIALLYYKLIDPAPKWGAEIAKKYGGEQMKVQTHNLTSCLKIFQSSEPWSINLLNLTNSIISCAAIESSLSRTPIVRTNQLIKNQLSDPRFCIISHTSNPAVLDVSNNSISPCNWQFIAALNKFVFK